MRKLFSIALLGLFLSIGVVAQDAAGRTAAAKELAAATLAAHGGDKLKGVKTLVLRGSATATAFNQAIPGSFVMIFSGRRYRLELNNQFQPLKQIFNGKETLTATPNSFRLPPIDRVGFYVLGRIGDPTFPITALPESSKKKGFRMTSPDGRYTDFYVDEKTKQVKGYDSAFDFQGQNGTTSVEVDKYRSIDGLLIPEKFAQRFDLGQITAYCEFKAKDILVDTPIADDVFTMQ
jgi:hypothetical protein